MWILSSVHSCKWVSKLPPPEEISGFFNITTLRFKLFESGHIPYVILYVFILGVIYLFTQVYFAKSLPLSLSNQEDHAIIQAAQQKNYSKLMIELNRRINSGKFGYFSFRFARLWLRWDRDQDLSAVISMKNEIIERDEEDVALSFVPITWIEWTLPLLGFLGTVIGIGGAIGGVQEGVHLLFSFKKITDVALLKFNAGFKSMALAFDTTFLGLLGLIVVGAIHFWMKRSIAGNLAKARELFSEVVSDWTQKSNEPVIMAIDGLSSSVHDTKEGLEKRIDELNSMVESEMEFRESSYLLVEHVIRRAPNLQWLREVIFEPIVEFAKADKEWISRTEQYVNEKVGHQNWKFVALTSSHNQIHTCLAIVKDEKEEKNFLFTFDIEKDDQKKSFEIPRSYNDVFSSMKSDLILARHERELVEILPQISLKEKVIDKNLMNEDMVYQFFIKEKEMLLVLKKKGLGFEVYYFEYLNKRKSEFLFQFPTDFNFSSELFVFEKFSGTLIALGISSNYKRKRIFMFSIQNQVVREEKEECEKLVCNQTNWFDIPNSLEVRQIIALRKGIILILDQEGKLYYWDKKHPEPSLLSHELWVSSEDSRIIAGAQGWIAVAAKDKLSMWNIRSGGFMEPYERLKDGLTISKLNKKNFFSTSGGCYLVGFYERKIFVWKYPKYIADKFF